MKPSAPQHRLSVTVDPKVAEWARQYSATHDMPISSLVEAGLTVLLRYERTTRTIEGLREEAGDPTKMCHDPLCQFAPSWHTAHVPGEYPAETIR
jgi:post-segregation antitoxin (ccd killing protein)